MSEPVLHKSLKAQNDFKITNQITSDTNLWLDSMFLMKAKKKLITNQPVRFLITKETACGFLKCGFLQVGSYCIHIYARGGITKHTRGVAGSKV